MQHYRANEYIVVSEEDVEPIYIEPTSPFFNYIQRMIDAEEELKNILNTFRNRGQFHEIQNYSQIVGDLERLIETSQEHIYRRAQDYQRLSPQEIAEHEESGVFEQARIKDGYMLNQINMLREFSVNENPTIAYAKIDDVMSEFEDAAAIEKEAFGERVAQQYSMAPMAQRDIDRRDTEVQTRENVGRHERETRESAGVNFSGIKSANERLDAEMRKAGVRPDSAFYGYIKERLRFKLNVESAIRVLSSKSGTSLFTEVDRELLEKLQYVAVKNDEVLETRYEHYNTLRSARSSMPIERIVDQKGKTYMERIASLDFQTNNQCLDIFREISNGISTPEQITQVDEMYNRILRIKKFDEELKSKSLGMENLEVNGQRRWTSKEKTARQMAREKSRAEEKRKNKQIAATLALAGTLIIGGIALGITLNSPSKQPIAPSVAVESGVANYEINQDGEDAKKILEDYIKEHPLEDGKTWVLEEGANGGWSARITSEHEETIGILESTIDNVDTEMIGAIAAALKEGNANIPSSVRQAYAVGDEPRGGTDEEFIRRAFADMDDRIEDVTYDGDSHQLSFQVAQLTEDLLKYEIAQAANDSGRYSGLTMENIGFYTTFKSNDEVKAYDILLLDTRGQKAGTIVRMDQIAGSDLDEAIRNCMELQRATEIVSVFEANQFTAARTSELYKFLGDLIGGDIDITFNAKGRPIISQESSEVPTSNEYDR